MSFPPIKTARLVIDQLVFDADPENPSPGSVLTETLEKFPTSIVVVVSRNEDGSFETVRPRFRFEDGQIVLGQDVWNGDNEKFLPVSNREYLVRTAFNPNQTKGPLKGMIGWQVVEKENLNSIDNTLQFLFDLEKNPISSFFPEQLEFYKQCSEINN